MAQVASQAVALAQAATCPISSQHRVVGSLPQTHSHFHQATGRRSDALWALLARPQTLASFARVVGGSGYHPVGQTHFDCPSFGFEGEPELYPVAGALPEVAGATCRQYLYLERPGDRPQQTWEAVEEPTFRLQLGFSLENSQLQPSWEAAEAHTLT